MDAETVIQQIRSQYQTLLGHKHLPSHVALGNQQYAALQAKFGLNVGDVEIPEETMGGSANTSAGVVHYQPVAGPRYLGIQRVDTDDFLEVLSSEATAHASRS
jgi:hypothetical protein